MGLLLPIGIVAFSLVLPCIFLVWLLRAKVESRAFLFSIVLLVAVDLVVDYLRGSLREPQGAAFNISSPLGNGTYYVVTGGANVFVNQHAMARVGTYAMDITRLNGYGLAAAGLFPSDLRKVYGAEIIAPCSGEVIAAEGTLSNRRPLDPDSSDRRGGNHVVIYCQGHSVHLAHMDPGSVAVAVGDRVMAGQLLGRVGNSGNTMMPHLHISAVRGQHPDFRSAAENGSVVSVPLLIDGRFLIKGESFTHRHTLGSAPVEQVARFRSRRPSQ